MVLCLPHQNTAETGPRAGLGIDMEVPQISCSVLVRVKTPVYKNRMYTTTHLTRRHVCHLITSNVSVPMATISLMPNTDSVSTNIPKEAQQKNILYA